MLHFREIILNTLCMVSHTPPHRGWAPVAHISYNNIFFIYFPSSTVPFYSFFHPCFLVSTPKETTCTQVFVWESAFGEKLNLNTCFDVQQLDGTSITGWWIHPNRQCLGQGVASHPWKTSGMDKSVMCAADQLLEKRPNCSCTVSVPDCAII